MMKKDVLFSGKGIFFCEGCALQNDKGGSIMKKKSKRR